MSKNLQKNDKRHHIKQLIIDLKKYIIYRRGVMSLADVVLDEQQKLAATCNGYTVFKQKPCILRE